MRTDELDFDLPPELIAQAPAPARTSSRLLHYNRADGSVTHGLFSRLPSLLRAGDLLVFNDARVIPARFLLQKGTGGKIEGLFLAEPESGKWRVMLKNFGAPRAGVVLTFVLAPEIEGVVSAQHEDGSYELIVRSSEPSAAILSRIGRMPLPPYIRRQKQADDRDVADRDRYQTVYARSAGSVAAPTAGLHFDDALMAALAARGVERTFVTLHVGVGTFKPVDAETLAKHAMHCEAYSIDPLAAEALNRARREGRRIVAVGTTAARVLESQPASREFSACSGETEIFIYPPYSWKHVGALITNFHLPRSTLIALVAAFVGLESQRMLYRMAIEQRYRFFSYGDAMLLE